MRIRFAEHVKSNLVGYIALVVALSGTAYAATAPPKNSVTTKSIKKGAVTGSKLANNSVTSPKVKDGSLTGADLNVATLGTIPEAAHAAKADSAANADHAGSADKATQADSATSAGSAGNSDQLGGSPAAAFLKGADSVAGGDLAGTYAQPSIGDGKVTSAKIADGTIAGADVGANALSGAQINEAGLNGVDADTFNSLSSFYYTHSKSNLGSTVAIATFQSATAANNTFLIENPRFQVRATGTAHQFKVCADSGYSVNQYFFVEANGARTTHALASGTCTAAIPTGGSGTTTPGYFMVWAPHAMVFGTPYTTNSSDSDTRRYQLIGIGWAMDALDA